MFFEFSKIAAFLVSPVHLLVALGFALTFWPQSGKRTGSLRAIQILLGILLSLLVFPVGNELLVPLETRFPAPTKLPDQVDGIIVLGGAVDEVVSAGQGHLSFNEDAERVLAPFSLLQRYPRARLVFTGGSGSLRPGPFKEGDKVRLLWRDANIDRGQVLYEEASRNTDENALFTRALVHPQPGEKWLLVTSAAHMPRSVGLFRKAGFDVIAYPVAFKSTGKNRQWYVPRTAGTALGNIESAVHEYVGLWVYYQTGRTDELFPAPNPSW
jgi:uncharacterized SAM-binding protein YcdF (DUF218 family)